jgi:hypothetical protein
VSRAQIKVLVHADGGACDGVVIGVIDGRCSMCNAIQDMQSTAVVDVAPLLRRAAAALLIEDNDRAQRDAMIGAPPRDRWATLRAEIMRLIGEAS